MVLSDVMIDGLLNNREATKMYNEGGQSEVRRPRSRGSGYSSARWTRRWTSGAIERTPSCAGPGGGSASEGGSTNGRKPVGLGA